MWGLIPTPNYIDHHSAGKIQCSLAKISTLSGRQKLIELCLDRRKLLGVRNKELLQHSGDRCFQKLLLIVGQALAGEVDSPATESNHVSALDLVSMLSDWTILS